MPERQVPILPGVIPEPTEEWRQAAMAQAHEDLPHIPNTRVVLGMFPLEVGLVALVDRLGFEPEEIETLRAQAKVIGGSDPHLVVASRMPVETRS